MDENRCPECNHLNKESTKFCTECGASLIQSSSSTPGGEASASERPIASGTQVGEVLDGRYHIDSVMSHGRSGNIYKAFDERLKKWCAIKENLDGSPEAQADFERKALMLAKHPPPSLPRISNYFILPDRGQYLVMEIEEGEDLENMTRRQGKLEVEQALEWISQVADALTYLHSQAPPLIHRDIKPANIHINQHGRAILLNIESPMRARSGTPGYAPVEQYGADGVDARADIYALGATLYRLLGGEPPPASIELTTGQSEMKPIERLNPKVPTQVARAIKRAMALNPNQRFQSVTQFRAALQAPLEENAVLVPGATLTPPPISAPPPVSAPPTPNVPPAAVEEKARPNKRVMLFAVGASAILVLVLVALLGGWLINQKTSELQEVSTSRANATIAARIEATSTQMHVETATAAQGIAQAQEVATIQAQTATAQAEASATAIIEAKATAFVAANYTAFVDANATAQAEATASGVALEDDLAALTTNKQLVYGPENGELEHEEDGRTERGPSSPNVADFVTEVRLFNPFALTVASWNYGLQFRVIEEQGYYRLVLTGKKNWYLEYFDTAKSDPWSTIHEGSISNLDTQAGGSNLLRVIASGDKGWLYVNDEFISELDLSLMPEGYIQVITGHFNDGEINGYSTKYQNFTVWSIQPPPGGPPPEGTAPQGTLAAVVTGTAQAPPARPPVGNFSALLFSDDFSSYNDKWDLPFQYSADWGKTWSIIRDGMLQVSHAAITDSFSWSCILDRDFADFILTVQATPLEGQTPFGYGVRFRHDSNKESYEFRLNNEGDFRVRLNDVENTTLVDWTHNAAIKEGGPNLIEIHAIGPDMEFYTNGELLASASDSTWETGQICLFVHQSAGLQAVAAFDNLNIYAP
jgi:serine/threonine protein kinase